MRTCFSLVVVSLAWPIAGPTRADEARDIITKAIAAHGGAANLAKFKAATWKGKGTFFGQGDPISYTGEWAMQGPDHARIVIAGEIVIPGKEERQPFKRTLVINDDKGWVQLNDDTDEMNAASLAEEKAPLYAGWVASLVPLADPEFQLTALAESQVGDRPVVGVKVSHANQRDISLFFDKEKGLLLKMEVKVKILRPGQEGREVTQEVWYSDYKEVQGVQRAMKLTVLREGKKFVESEWSDYKLLDKLDDSVFAKP